MSNLIDPRCSVPTFQQTDLYVVERCGRLSGYFTASILSLFLIVGSIVLFVSINKKGTVDETKEQIDKRNKNKITYNIITGVSLFLLLVAIWFGIPKLISFFNKREWQGAQSEISELMKQGYSRQDAISKIQSLYETNIKAQATRSIGTNISDAIRSTKN